MSSVLVCGFECGRLDDGGPHWDLAGTDPAEIDTVTVRSGARSLRHNPVANGGAVESVLGNSDHVVVRCYIRFTDLPNDDCLLMWTSSGVGTIGLAFKQSTGTLHCATSWEPISLAGAGAPVSIDVWYRIDLHIDQTPGARTCDAQITADGDEESTVVLTQKSDAESPGQSPLRIGTYMGGGSPFITADINFDDFVISHTPADYPIGAGYVNHFVPTSDGSHNIAAANDFERGSTGTDITNATTTAYQLVDDVPLPAEETATGDDFIFAASPTNSTDYVELKIGPAPSVSTPTQGPTGIDVLVARHQTNSDSTTIRVALNDNGTLDDVLNATGVGDTTRRFTREHYTNPPSPASEWHADGDGSDGDFTDLRFRFYSNAGAANQCLDAIMIEAEFPALVPGPTPGGYYACIGTLPTFQTAEQDKIDALRALKDAGEKYGPVFELVKVEWPEPDGTIYYAVMKTDEVSDPPPPVTPIEARLKPDGYPAWFLPVQIDSAIGDEEVDLEFWDGDGVISDLLADHGEGIRTTLYYWFPIVELMLPIWHGHLRQEDEAEVDICKLKAVQGFRSSEGLLPRRAHYRECQAIFGAVFDTQAEIDENDCPYNKHIGGSVGNFVTGTTPYTSCPRRTRQNCIDRLGNNGNYMLSHATASTIVANNQTKGSRLYSTSAGNETNLKDPVIVVMGVRRIRGMLVVAFRKDENNNDPENGFIFLIMEACEGPVLQISYAEITFGSDSAPADPFNFNYRLGDQGQTAMDSALTVHSYSSTALIRARSGWVDPATIDISSISGTAIIHGLRDIRVYTDETTYTEEWTDNRAWHIMRMLTDKRWGYGYDYDRLDIPSFIEAACWCANYVRFTDDNGDTWDHIRSLSNLELRGRKVQQQIEDVCLAGRLSRPFLFNGKIHIVPLRAMTSSELAAAPVFTDEGTTGRNIIWEDGKSTLKRSRISDLELPNRIECTFDDASDDYIERPAPAIEDIDAQLRAGRVVGDFSRKLNVKKYPLAGVVIEGQAIKMGTALRDLGPFDEGGLVNNLRLPFKIWFLDSLDLFPSKVIKVESSSITRYGFDYFRVMTMKRAGNLHVELEVQAYNETYMDAFEELYGGIDPIPDDPDDPDAGTAIPPTDPLEYTSVSYSSGVLTITSEAT